MLETSGSRKGHAEPPVAFLDVRNAAYEYDGRDSDLRFQIPIHPNDEFYLGRNSPALEFAHTTVSKRHLKLHCILFDHDGEWGIQPLVYAEDISTNGTYLKRAQTLDRIMMRPHAQITLLDEYDELWIAPLKFLRYRVEREHRGKHCAFRPEVEMDMKVISRRYQVKPRKIGEGGYGAVHVAIHWKTQRQLACKFIDLELLRQNGRYVDKLTQEFEVLKDLDHPNIIGLEKVYRSDAGLYIFQELISGGDLFSFIINRHEFGVSAIEAAVIVYQILKGVDYLHNNGIVHRDLKPDNILLTSTKTGCRVVITDFGQARFLPEGNATQRMKTVAGTVGFNAPEIFRNNPKIPSGSGYSKAVDIWSIGCVAAQLLTGKPVFHDNDAENPEAVVKTLSSTCNLDVLENDPVWQRVGRRAKDFIRRTVVLAEGDRLSAREALRHEWFSNPAHADELEAVYQHVTKDWAPRRKIFRIIEQIPPSRLKMQLHPSRFLPFPKRRPLPVVDLISGQSPVMPIIEEEVCPGPSPTGAPSTALDEESENPGPPESWGETASEQRKLREVDSHSTGKPPLPIRQPTTRGVVQQNSNTTYGFDQETRDEQQLTPTQLLTQKHLKKKQDLQMHYGADSFEERSSILDRQPSDVEKVHRTMTQLSLIEQQDEANMNLRGTRQPSFDFDQETTQESPSQQQHGAMSLGKRQPSFDFDQGMNDVDFWEAAVTAEFKQPTAKKLRSG